MKLGFTLRRANTFIQEGVRTFFRFAHFFMWALFDPTKFKWIDTKKVKNILVIQNGALGDTYILMGFLNNIKRNYPKVNLFSLTPESKRKYFKSPFITVVDIETAKKMIKDKKFDAAVVLDIPYSYNIFSDLRKIPYVTCADYINITGFFNKRFFFFTRYVFPIKTGHEYYAEGFKPLGINADHPEFYFTKKGDEEAKRFIKKHKINKNKKMIFCHVAVGNRIRAIKEGKRSSRELLPERWAEVATKLVKKYNARVIFTGTKEDKEIINKSMEKIKNKSHIINAAGQLSIEGTISLLKKGDLLISVDTSMIHFGAQSGIPLVGLYGQFPIRHSHPLTDNKIILFHHEVCNSCRNYYCPEFNQICIDSITSDEIMEAAEKIFSNNPKHTKI